MRRTVSTIIVGPSSLLREGVDFTIRRSHYKLTASAECFQGISKDSWAQHHAPSLTIVLTDEDIALQAVDTVQSLRRHRPADCIVVICTNRSVQQDALLQAGANACIPWSISPDILFLSLNVLMARDVALAALTKPEQNSKIEIYSQQPDCASIQARDSGSVSSQALTRREMEVLQAVARGDSNKLIANRLSLREPTVKSHMRLILKKIGMQNRTQAATWAVANGWLPNGKTPSALTRSEDSQGSPDLRVWSHGSDRIGAPTS